MNPMFPNLNEVGKWLESKIYVTNFRPVSINEFAKIGNEIYNKNG